MASDTFTEIAASSRRLADLCDRQKNTVAWWAEYGAEFQTLTQLIMVARPMNPKHEQSAHRAMAAVRKPE